MPKSHLLLLGGTGFIGRNIVYYWLKEHKAESIVVVDKVPPELAWMNQDHRDAFNDPRVQFRSANLIIPEACREVFDRSDGIKFDLVINCAGETRSGQSEAVYQDGILKLSLYCAREAVKRKIRFIELSSGNMNSLNRMHRESDPVAPWTSVAKWKRRVEEELFRIPCFEFTIIRLPIVYGRGDRTGLMPRILEAAICKRMGKPIKQLWNSDKRISTVHVHDVTRAIFHVRARVDTKRAIFNVVDFADSSQGSIWNVICSMFEIRVDFTGNLMSRLKDLTKVANEANVKYMTAWAEALREENIVNTPLCPYTDLEQLVNKHLSLVLPVILSRVTTL
ncbi:unnamed protein product [Acanthoscelides obtectus]|uniref:NAD-dependent epimerase/dehydratase domain-containing protein n=1 Tax=Acanthoscelides obtectus TaxID=200917 RepID=A0A9P0KI64_ACAOB|nr:unnamed protein product [Acanthoscelides obtectus]CAK1666703.1 hypothetical protein AOBTE_LOCUS25443 [Acanthoscelides obtectus]